jgi:hypothetical protein
VKDFETADQELQIVDCRLDRLTARRFFPAQPRRRRTVLFSFVVSHRRAIDFQRRLLAIAASLILSFPLVAQEKLDTAAIDKIKDEGLMRSQVMEIASWLTDVYGPRLTGSPNIKEAGDWTVKRLTEWGVVNAKLEPWGPFGRGWTNDYISVQVVAPRPFPVIAYAAAWTPGTNGPLTAEVVRVQIDSTADFSKYRGRLRGKFVMLSGPRSLPPHLIADARRWTDVQLDSMEATVPTPSPGRGGRGGPQGVNFAQTRAQFLVDEGVAAVITIGAGSDGTVFTGGTGSRDPATPTRLPGVLFAAEHYNRILRLLDKQIPVQLELNVRNKFYDEDLDSFNIVGDIPGTDPRLKDELVMLGAHFDSWHAGTGATDNAAGSAVMLEAVRILKATKLPLRRTVRIGLWTGEEQGLLGSRAYVREHFGDPQTMVLKPAHAKFAGYFNVDNGTGKIRGIYLQGNTAVAPIFQEWLKPFAAMGSRAINPSNTGGTDHLSFDAVGLPGWQFVQDPVDYGSRTHHSNMDVWDRLVADDMKHNAVVVAAFVYLTANRDESLPRKPLPVRQPVP